MKYTHSTHLLDFGSGYGLELAIVCGNYCRRVRDNIFGGGSYLAEWARVPHFGRNTTKLIPCTEPIVLVEGSGMLNTSDNLH